MAFLSVSLLGCTNYTITATRIVSSIEKQRKLRTLELAVSAKQVTDYALSSLLISAEKLTQLQQIVLSVRHQMGEDDGGLRSLVRFTENLTNLTKLTVSISADHVTDDGMRILARSIEKLPPQLMTLNVSISTNQVTFGSICALADSAEKLARSHKINFALDHQSLNDWKRDCFATVTAGEACWVSSIKTQDLGIILTGEWAQMFQKSNCGTIGVEYKMHWSLDSKSWKATGHRHTVQLHCYSDETGEEDEKVTEIGGTGTCALSENSSCDPSTKPDACRLGTHCRPKKDIALGYLYHGEQFVMREYSCTDQAEERA